MYLNFHEKVEGCRISQRRMISGASDRGGGLVYSLHLEAATSCTESHTPIGGKKRLRAAINL